MTSSLYKFTLFSTCARLKIFFSTNVLFSTSCAQLNASVNFKYRKILRLLISLISFGGLLSLAHPMDLIELVNTKFKSVGSVQENQN